MFIKLAKLLKIDYQKENGLIHEAKCHDGEGLIEFPIGRDSLLNFSICSKSNRIYLVGGLWKYPYGNETKKAKVDDKLKYQMGGAKFEINKTVLTFERDDIFRVNVSKLNISSYYYQFELCNE